MVTVFMRATNTTVGPTVVVTGGCTSSSAWAISGYTPARVPASQLYYWTSMWQQGEQESLRDVASGNTARFSDPLDAIRWLLGTEEQN